MKSSIIQIAPIACTVVALLAGCKGEGSDSLDTGDTDTCTSETCDAPTDTDDTVFPLGPWDVGHRRLEATDTARDNRTLPLDVWYPIDPEDKQGTLTVYPLGAGINLPAMVAIEDPPVSATGNRKLILFSHGSEGVSTQSTPLMETLASYGYVVVAPEHIGNSQGAPGDSFDVAAQNRFDDVSFVVDTMFARNNDGADDFFGAIDESGVGVTGHSFGGWTAIAAAAGWEGAQGDDRVAAIAPISAVIEDRFSTEVLSSLSLPVLLLGGTKDTDVPISNNAYAFENLSSPAYQVDIKGATHTHFANVCAIGDKLIELGLGKDQWSAIGAEALLAPYEQTCTEGAFPLEQAVRLQNLYVVTFFNHHLQGMPDKDGVLTQKYALDNEPDVAFSGK